jgi:pilus assembly protein CpaB
MARRTRPLVLLTLALASGALAAFLALRFLRQQATPILPAAPRRAEVVVAARALPVGSLIGERDVKLVEWSGPSAPPGFFATAAEVIGRGVIVPLQDNEPVLEAKLAPVGAGGGLAVMVDEGMRAVSIGVDQVVGVAGFVLPGTRVDVLLTLTKGETQPTTKVIMQNLETLAAGQSIQVDREGKPQTVPVVTLLVSPEQAETLALAANQGQIQLALRNTLDTITVRTSGTRVNALLGGTVVRGGTRRRASQPAASPTVVEVYRGGERTLQRF